LLAKLQQNFSCQRTKIIEKISKQSQNVASSAQNATANFYSDTLELLKKYFPLTPKEIITHLNLKKPIYKKTASYGHFGRTPGEDGSFSWEKTNKTELLREKFEEHTA